MARSTKTSAAPKIAAERSAPPRAKRGAAAPAVVAKSSPSVKTLGARPLPASAPSKAAPTRREQTGGALPAAAPRVPPPTKGELRAHIEKIEAANAALKAKGREANRAAKLAARRIAELEEQLDQLQAKATKTAASAPSSKDADAKRQQRPTGRKKAFDPGDAVPPGVAVQEAEPLDAEAAAAREALEKNL